MQPTAPLLLRPVVHSPCLFTLPGNSGDATKKRALAATASCREDITYNRSHRIAIEYDFIPQSSHASSSFAACCPSERVPLMLRGHGDAACPLACLSGAYQMVTRPVVWPYPSNDHCHRTINHFKHPLVQQNTQTHAHAHVLSSNCSTWW